MTDIIQLEDKLEKMNISIYEKEQDLENKVLNEGKSLDEVQELRNEIHDLQLERDILRDRINILKNQ